MHGSKLSRFSPPLPCPPCLPFVPLTTLPTAQRKKQMTPDTVPPCPKKAGAPHLLPDLGVYSCRKAADIWPQGTGLQDSLQPRWVQLLPEAHVLQHRCVLDPGLLGHVGHRTLKHNSLWQRGQWGWRQGRLWRNSRCQAIASGGRWREKMERRGRGMEAWGGLWDGGNSSRKAGGVASP